ncbi:aspartate-semialdehyde dehydrogenase [candidate division KSB1 bacterium]
MKKIPVGILGATGIVGQRLLLMLADHPWFEIKALTASDDSADKAYSEVCQWKMKEPIPEKYRKTRILKTTPDIDCRLVFSALTSTAAQVLEKQFALCGFAVVSNAGAHRMNRNVPLIIPEVNAGHIDIVENQSNGHEDGRGYIVTNPNCVAVPLSMVLAPLHRKWGIKQVIVSTMQAVSGAGYPGNSSMDLIDNVIPFIKNEEEKIETETKKILGVLNVDKIIPARMDISAQVHRVPVQDGHLLSASIKFNNKVRITDVIGEIKKDSSAVKNMKLPSMPERPLVYHEEIDRPQPRLDRDTGKGMSVVVGRIRKCSVLDVKMNILGHNTIRGAAGAAVLNAELLKVKGMLQI